ncbi:MAG: hypothetical protein JNK87_24040 [Bryobacterales bacterium]|nr:hypothetical protein [Bryobacterales bacterium]
MHACFWERQVAHVLWVACLLSAGCGQQAPAVTPVIEFRVVPEAGPGGPDRMATIAGTVRGVRAGQRIVLFAKSGQWWVQPFSNRPYTAIADDGGFESATHLGTEYAAVLVDASYKPPKVVERLPVDGAGVVAVASVAGKAGAPAPPSYLQFSGYDWEVVEPRAGRPPTAWTDGEGRLHLKVTKEGNEWTRAEVAARRSLGYGTYSFTIREMPVLEPATAFRMFTWDQDEGGQNHREIDIELSRWGDRAIKNAQFVVQPYYVAANSFRFEAPGGSMQHAFRWEPGRVSFRSVPLPPSRVAAEHVFTSGIPTPGLETVHLNLYVYAKSRTPQQKPVEVVIEKFEFLP